MCWALIGCLLPSLSRVALAAKSARSSHAVPTPQGAGVAVVATLLATALPTIMYLSVGSSASITCAASLITLCWLGFTDDKRPLTWQVRLFIQSLVAVVVAAFIQVPALADLPDSVTLALLILFTITVVNLTNFIDGIDEITAAHAAPALAAAALAALAGSISLEQGVLAAAGLGAVAGFWFWNRHPARIFLGDAGSLPLGLLLSWLALAMASRGHWAAGLLILLYPIADGGITLAMRVAGGQNIVESHRAHGYQRAVDAGVPVRRVSGSVHMLSTGNAIMALATVLWDEPLFHVFILVVAVASTLALLNRWMRPIQRM